MLVSSLLGVAGGVLVKHAVSKMLLPRPEVIAAKVERTKIFVANVLNLRDAVMSAKREKLGLMGSTTFDRTEKIHRVCQSRAAMKNAAHKALGDTPFRGLLNIVQHELDDLLKCPRTTMAELTAKLSEVEIAVQSILATAGN